MERLTPAEEKVMLKLWSLEKTNVQGILDLYETPKPNYNTISTIVRILEKKKYIKHKAQGRGFVYSPKLTKEQYRDQLAENLLQHYFDGDRNELISYYNSKKSLDDLL
ncbi:MAG: BlaI/MecI/CopY family transcriptional regulator [Fluviicola sp.]|jgi:predicted transcriptional regulator|nr:BlaI/MecI/CopY family transcriptional regulator [Fluviicola sp.]